jgi:hypothetical protein
MSDANIEISLPLDNDGCLSRECPYCKMRFKIHKDDMDGEKLPAEIFCPYCGQSDSKDEFWTSEQIKYFHDIAVFKVVAPQLDEFKNSIRSLNTISSAFGLKVNVDGEEISMPMAPEEIEDMTLRKRICCDIAIKIDNTWTKEFYCPICGKKDD